MQPCQTDRSIGKICPYSYQETLDWLGPVDFMLVYDNIGFN